MNEWNSLKRSDMITVSLRKVVGASASLSLDSSCCSCSQYRRRGRTARTCSFSLYATLVVAFPDWSPAQAQPFSTGVSAAPLSRTLRQPPSDITSRERKGDVAAGLKSKAKRNRSALIFSLWDHFKYRQR